jgi:hypothetical protein
MKMENFEEIDVQNVPIHADADDIEIIGVFQGLPELVVNDRMEVDAIAQNILVHNDSDDDMPIIGPALPVYAGDDEFALREYHPSIHVARILSRINTQDEYTLVSRHLLQDLLPRKSTALPHDFASIETVVHEFDARLLTYYTDRMSLQ